MKKLLISLSLFSVLLLGACADPYVLTDKVVITNVEVVKVDTRNVGRGSQYYIEFIKDDKKQQLDISNPVGYDIQKEVSNVKKTNSILGSSEKIEYDLMVDGDVVEFVSLSKNKK